MSAKTEVESLREEVDILRKKLVLSEKKVEVLSEELELLRDSVRSLEKKVGDLSEKKDVKCETLPEKKVDDKEVGRELTFKPMKHHRDEKEVIVFMTTQGFYKYYFIAEDLAAGLDPEKPATMVIETCESHCHDCSEEECVLARQYFVPKGEYFFICRGKVSQ